MRGGRHRGYGLPTRARAVIVTVAILAAVGALAIWRMASAGPCSGRVQLTVAGSPQIAPALAQATQRWAQGARGDGGECVAVQVSTVSPADVALALASAGGVALTGLTPLVAAGASASSAPASSTAIPDVWVPDSSTWLVRLRSAGANLVPAQAPSIAESPVVVAMPEPLARSLGWPTAMPTWSELLQKMTTAAGLKVGIVEPNRDAAGLSGLVALGSAALSAGASSDQTTVAMMRALFAGRSSAATDLVQRFPTSGDPAALAAALGAAPLAEQAVIVHNATKPAVPLAALYVQPAPPPLDFPYAVMPGIPSERARLADDLRTALGGADFAQDLAASGLRTANGMAAFAPPAGAPSQIVAAPLDGAAVSKALATWVSVTRPARMLAVLDVSGSMAYQVAGAGGATRAQIALAAAKQGMMLFDDSWSVGLWTFSTNLDGDKPYKQILPILSMAEQRPNLIAALDTIKPLPNGNTGLYATVLAAYQTVKDGWDPNAVNSVVLLTDGHNDDANGPTLDQLINSLQALVDPRHPVQVIAIGIGDDVSQAELDRITNTTGGGTFIARDPTAIGPIFLQALSLRPAQS